MSLCLGSGLFPTLCIVKQKGRGVNWIFPGTEIRQHFDTQCFGAWLLRVEADVMRECERR